MFKSSTELKGILKTAKSPSPAKPAPNMTFNYTPIPPTPASLVTTTTAPPITVQGDGNAADALISQLFSEIDTYEKTSSALNVVDRMEKVVSQKLAEKDKIILA